MTKQQLLKDMSLDEFLEHKLFDDDAKIHDTSVWLNVRINDMVDIVRKEYNLSKRRIYQSLTEYGVNQLEEFVHSKKYKDVQMDLKRINIESEFAGEIISLKYVIMQGVTSRKTISIYHNVSGQIGNLADVLMLTRSQIIILSIVFGLNKYKGMFGLPKKVISGFSDYLLLLRRYYLRYLVPSLGTEVLEKYHISDFISKNNEDSKTLIKGSKTLLKLLLPVISGNSIEITTEFVHITTNLIKMYQGNYNKELRDKVQILYLEIYIFFRGYDNITEILDKGIDEINKLLEEDNEDKNVV